MASDPGVVDKARIRHRKFNRIMGTIAAVAGVVSLAIGVVYKWYGPNGLLSDSLKSAGQGIAMAWAILPPVFFWYDWCYLSYGDKDDLEFQKETHNLARNIWLALVVVLGVLFEVKIQG